MRVLVTGAGGFIGSHVLRRLTDDGHEVTGVDISEEALQRVAREIPGLSVRALKLDDILVVGSLLQEAKPDALIHLAWYANPQDYLTSHANLSSLTMTVILVEAVLAAGCRKLVLSGSCAEYATQNRLLLESDLADPRTIYAASKEAARQVARILATEAHAELSWARIFHIHGRGEDRRRLVPWVASEIKSRRRVALTDGSQVRDHLHVEDVAAGLVALLTPGTNGVFNICSGRAVTLRHVLETVGDILGGRELLDFGALPHRANDTMFLAGDSSRLRSIGWQPRFGLRDGLADALSGWF